MNGDIPQIRFLGAAGTVTGSKYLLTYQDKKILIDCGLFQGLKELRIKNWDRFPVNPADIDAVVLTHAHIDHSGYIPRLIKEGFKGKIYSTRATLALAKILLPDTGYLQEEEADYLNRKRLSKHKPALPLFDKKEAEKSLEYFVPKEFDSPFELLPGVEVKFIYAGHIFGAAQVVLTLGGVTIGFSGDVGRLNDPILFAPAKIPEVDYLVVESTYGNRKHIDADPMNELGEIVRSVHSRNGVIMIPAFTVGRAQTLMYFLNRLKKTGQIPAMPMYLNSPMATNVTNLLCEFMSLHKLNQDECNDTCAVVHYVKSVEESKALNARKGPMLIISASGMATGGRILHHLKAFASDPKNCVVLAGFQAKGTRGRLIQDGANEIKIHGEMIPLRAEVKSLSNLSAHADYEEIISWLKESQIQPQKVFITHGEPEAAMALKAQLENKLKFACQIPVQDQEFELR